MYLLKKSIDKQALITLKRRSNQLLFCSKTESISYQRSTINYRQFINWYLVIFFVILLENHSETQQIKWFQTHQTLIRQKVFL